MKSKFITIVLFFIMIILIIGIVGLSSYIYLDLMSSDSEQLIYKLDGIITEEPIEHEESVNTIDSNDYNQVTISEGLTESRNNNLTSDKSISSFFYKQLTDNQKIIYDKLKENKYNLKQGDYVINYNSTFSDLLKSEGGSEKLGDDYQTAIEAFTHDNPDLFYLDVNKMYLNIETTTQLLKTKYNVYISPKQGGTYLSDDFKSTEEIENAIQQIEVIKNKILSQAKNSDYENILYIHDYLIDNIEYDQTYNAKGTYSIYGALVGKSCVCEGYTKAFKYLANSVGIECEMLQGVATNGYNQTENHAWNCVNLNGTWYELDTTWDDPIVIGNGKIGNSVRYKYFLKGTDTFEKDHVLSYQFSTNGKKFAYPELSTKDY